ncbi:MAG: radical SAM protein [Chloroflexi bacterium]|nr:radical SAM protein [Chloroflexota bacterium]
MTTTCDPITPAQTIAPIQLDLPEGVPPLTSLYVYAAGSCNLACRHCWIVPKFQPDGDGGPYVKLEYVEKAIREGKPLGLRSIKLTGGEPMLHPQFRELVSLINDAGLDIVIETNGTLVDDTLAKFLKEKSRVCFISVSLDGVKPETHDALRSVPGSYDRAVAGIKNLVAVGFRPQVICTLHRGNVSEMAEVVSLAEKLGCGSVKFNHVQQTGRGERFCDDQGLDVVEIIQLYRRIEDEIAPQSRVPIHFDIPFAFFPIRKLLNDALGRCTVKNILGMLATGELALCGIGTTIPELIYGHAETNDLYEVWCTSPGLVRLREQIPLRLEGICAQCLHRDICQGECVANNFHVAGKLNAPYYFCDRANDLGLFPPPRNKQPVVAVCG